MKLLHKKSGELHEAVIELVEDEDWEVIRQNKNFGFKWIKEQNQIVHKIRLVVEEEILGLISTEDIPKELRIHIRLIEVNAKDRGQNKRYDYIAGCLFGFTCNLAFEQGYDGYISLYSKTAIIEYYKAKYGFSKFGQNLYTELEQSQALIDKYLNNG